MMMRRLVVLVAATALVVLGAAPALADHYTMEITVNPTATLNEFKTLIHVSGTYTCSGDFVPEFSGFGGEVFQSQKGGKVVIGGGFGIDGNDLVCDGTEQTWDADVQPFAGDDPAVWKRGRVVINGGGNISDGVEHEAGDGYLQSLKITR